MPDRISFTRPSVERIAGVVRAVENARPGGSPLTSRAVLGGPRPKPFRVCTFTGAWAIDTAKTVTFRNVTSTPNTVSATNIFLALPDRGSQPCGIAKDGTAWHLIAWVPVTQATATASILTGVSLSTAGLEFTQLNIKILATVSSSVITISTTACT
jgi:hypothetical protein